MAKYNKMIDYTLLDNDATKEDIIRLCEKARIMNVKSVCVMPKHVIIAAEELSDCDILVCTVISFPEGTNTLKQKIAETNQVIQDGADEIDVVLDYQYLKKEWNDTASNGGDLEISKSQKLIKEISELVRICHANENKDGDEITLKVIVESGLLTPKQTEVATIICLESGADFIKTSTSKVAVGDELEKVKVMKDTIDKYIGEYDYYYEGFKMKINVSGNIRTIQDIKKFKPYVDRFSMDYVDVDKLNGLE
ncbi:MAG: deoxyribose-phosphate aldolase [Ignavibacteria bacterium]|nr:deoxyribose-phosphate aldolase [Ignavibacteria bacterium]